jgi:uncharacterized BrkB/YihY/UPF0761 family membrane protein
MDSSLVHTLMVWAGIGLFFFALTMFAVTDVLRKNFGSTKSKTFWGLISLFPFVGWMVYLLFGFRKGTVAGPNESSQE